MPIKDKRKRKKYNRDYNRRRMNEPAYNAAHRVRVRARDDRTRLQTRQLIADFRAAGCRLCPETEDVCLCAHHIDPSKKDFNIGNGIGRKFEPAKIAAELAKCACLCHNCHAKVHAGLATIPEESPVPCSNFVVTA